MPEVSHDAALPYVTAKGVIRASNDSSDWIGAFKGDIVSFLVSLSTQAGALFGSANIAASGSTIKLTTSSSASDFKMVCEYDSESNCKIALKWLGDNSHILVNNFDIHSKHPIYWAIYKGIARTTTEGSQTTSSYAPDIMVVLARDSSVTLTGEVSSYHEPTEAEWSEQENCILDNICRYVPAALMFTSGINSLTNAQNECCVIALHNTSYSAGITWASSSTMEHGFHIVERSGSGKRIGTYRTGPSPSSGGYTASVMITADTVYYPPLGSTGETLATNARVMTISPASSINYVTPVWSMASACITSNTKGIAWGGYLDTTYGLKEGPQLTPELGTAASPNYHIRCYDLYMPVANPSNGDDNND